MDFNSIDNQPYSVTENTRFKHRMQILYQSSSNKAYFNVAATRLTTNIWSSAVSLMPMLSLTVQWITVNFERRQVIFHKSSHMVHTAEALVDI